VRSRLIHDYPWQLGIGKMVNNRNRLRLVYRQENQSRQQEQRNTQESGPV
jgi:hypothetical protein